VISTIDSFRADLIVLAGCLMYIPSKLIQKYPNRIINIHPSLIPSFCGKGYYGLTVHEKVLERGVKVTGATVHFVDEVLDNGPILLQKAVSVEPDDTPESLQLRVMQQAEWKILPEAIRLIAQGRVKIEGRKAIITETEEKA
jgi:phosphoribosylglycinamide formyltransferase-1